MHKAAPLKLPLFVGRIKNSGGYRFALDKNAKILYIMHIYCI